MRRFRVGLLYGGVGYLVGAVAGFLLVLQFSGNVHDREIEAAMTSAFVLGPAAALIGFVVGALSATAHPSAQDPQN